MTTRQGPSQPIRAGTGQDYGVAKTQRDMQRVNPLPDNRGAGQQTAAGPPGQGAPAGPPATGPQVPDLYGPTMFPNEPGTAGAALGPGPGSLEGLLPPDDLPHIRAAAMMFPDPALYRLLELHEQKRRQRPRGA